MDIYQHNTDYLIIEGSIFDKYGCLVTVRSQLVCDPAVLAIAQPKYMRTLYRSLLKVWRGDREKICRGRVLGIRVGDPTSSLFVPRAKNESEDHRTLKLYAYQWLKEIQADASFETSYPAGVADAASRKAKIAIECGTTDVSKILEGVRSGWTVIWLPYGSWPNPLRPASEFSSQNVGSVQLDSLFKSLSVTQIETDTQIFRASAAAYRRELTEAKPVAVAKMTAALKKLAPDLLDKVLPVIESMTPIERSSLGLSDFDSAEGVDRLRFMAHALAKEDDGLGGWFQQ